MYSNYDNLITGFADGERDEVIAHMAKYGELVEAVEDEASGALVVHFKNRRAAEVAMGKAAHFGEENREANSIEKKLTYYTIFLLENSLDLA